MKHTFKRVACLTLALLMVLALSATAFADGATGDPAGNVYAGDSKTTVTDTSIPLTKSIVMFNKNGSRVYEPNISYTYSVAHVTADSELGTITDDGDDNHGVPVTVTVNAGVPDGVKFEGTANTITFSIDNDAVKTEADGVEVTKTTNLTVDISKFKHAGVYRYKITEIDNSTAVTAAGMVRPEGYSSVRYLDVYIKNGTSGLELSGAVIFKTNAQDKSTPVNDATDAITTTTEKTTGFEPGKPGESTENPGYTSDTSADHYTTYDIEVKKVVSGGMGDKTHNFPFYVNLTNSINNAKYTYVDDEGTSAAETISGTGITGITKGTDSKASALALKDGESVKFIGVPSSNNAPLTIAVKEWNDTVDFYVATAAVTNGNAPAVTMDGDTNATKMQANTGFATLDDFNVKANDAERQTITVTNTLETISPTGVVLRVAPYAIMLGFGLALMLFSRKMRKVED